MHPTTRIGHIEAFKRLTREQGSAVVSPARTLKVEAAAGSGKSTTAMAYISARANMRGLYLVFGKENQLQADARLRALNTKTQARTSHSLAYQSFGAPLRAAGKLGRGALRPVSTAGLLGVDYPLASAINGTLTTYMASADARIDEQHIPDDPRIKLKGVSAGQIIAGARVLWARMCNPADTAAHAVDDVYLKQWAMTLPRLDYDFIIYDEYQDANPLTASLVQQQQHATQVFIGDRHQSIYAFRGATDAMESTPAEQTIHLTTSHRFTHNIGVLADTFLKHWKRNTVTLTGAARAQALLPTDQQAMLSRTVAGLIGRAIQLHSQGKRLHWVKGFESYRVANILDAHRLWAGRVQEISDPLMRSFGSWGRFCEYVETSQDGESRPIHRLVQEYRQDIPGLISSLSGAEAQAAEGSDFVMTTAHRAKGLEWPIVHLVDDYFSLAKEQKKSSSPQDAKASAAAGWKNPKDVDPQEINLTYVALTRAQKAIAPTPEMLRWFSQQPATQPIVAPKAPAEPEPQTAAAPSAR